METSNSSEHKDFEQFLEKKFNDTQEENKQSLKEI